MKLSTRSRYGLKAMVDLAVAAPRHAPLFEGGKAAQPPGGSRVAVGTPMPLSVLAQNQGISEAYLEQLLRALKQAGLVTAKRGVNGGYCIARPPESISVEDVLRALEGSTAVADCVSRRGEGCASACTCSARPLFLKLQSQITAVLESTTIQDLANEHKEQKERIHHAKKRLS